jgi:prevent-host-death family protein
MRNGGMKSVSFTEFRNNASSLVDLVEQGEEVEIRRHGKLVARLVSPVSRRERAW